MMRLMMALKKTNKQRTTFVIIISLRNPFRACEKSYG